MKDAHSQNRTGDLFLTKKVLYRLSYVGVNFDVFLKKLFF